MPTPFATLLSRICLSASHIVEISTTVHVAICVAVISLIRTCLRGACVTWHREILINCHLHSKMILFSTKSSPFWNFKLSAIFHVKNITDFSEESRRKYHYCLPSEEAVVELAAAVGARRPLEAYLLPAVHCIPYKNCSEPAAWCCLTDNFSASCIVTTFTVASFLLFKQFTLTFWRMRVYKYFFCKIYLIISKLKVWDGKY